MTVIYCRTISLRICFHGAIQASMFISETGSVPMTRSLSATLPDTLSVHALSAKASLRDSGAHGLHPGARFTTCPKSRQPVGVDFFNA